MLWCHQLHSHEHQKTQGAGAMGHRCAVLTEEDQPATVGGGGGHTKVQ